MRCSYLSLMVLTSLLLLAPATVYAQRRQGRRVATPARQPATGRPSRQSMTPGGEVGGDEQQVMARVRGYQSQLEREEKVLAQRMAYAAQLRRQGLEKKDQSLLDQAEQYERKSLAAYQGRVKLFERANLNPESGRRGLPSVKAPKIPNRVPSATRPTRRQPSRSRSSRSAKNAWGWLR